MNVFFYFNQIYHNDTLKTSMTLSFSNPIVVGVSFAESTRLLNRNKMSSDASIPLKTIIIK